jgi:hypothetical protein
MTAACRVCGDSGDVSLIDGRMRAIKRLLGPRWRATIGTRLRDFICHPCQRWAARMAGAVL